MYALTLSLPYHRLINWTQLLISGILISTMAKSLLTIFLLGLSSSDVAAFSLSMSTEPKSTATDALGSRRSFLSTTFATAVVGGSAILSQNPQPSYAAPEILNTPSGIKYAITKESKDKKPIVPLSGEYAYRRMINICITCICDMYVYIYNIIPCIYGLLYTCAESFSILHIFSRRYCCNRIHWISCKWSGKKR